MSASKVLLRHRQLLTHTRLSNHFSHTHTQAHTTMAPIKIAVLDDYQGFADKPFSQLDSSKYNVTSLKDTLLPYNHVDTPQSVKDELVKRLEPYEIISMVLRPLSL